MKSFFWIAYVACMITAIVISGGLLMTSCKGKQDVKPVVIETANEVKKIEMPKPSPSPQEKKSLEIEKKK